MKPHRTIPPNSSSHAAFSSSAVAIARKRNVTMDHPLFRSFIASESGSTPIEYALISVLLSATVYAGTKTIVRELVDLFDGVTTAFQSLA